MAYNNISNSHISASRPKSQNMCKRVNSQHYNTIHNLRSIEHYIQSYRKSSIFNGHRFFIFHPLV